MYREVTMVEVKEVLRLWRAGVPTKRLAAQLGLDPRRRGGICGRGGGGPPRDGRPVSDDDVREVLLALPPTGGRPRGDGWAAVSRSARRSAVARRRTPAHQDSQAARATGRAIAYPTLYRFAVLELQFGQTATTIPVLDGAPGRSSKSIPGGSAG